MLLFNLDSIPILIFHKLLGFALYHPRYTFLGGINILKCLYYSNISFLILCRVVFAYIQSTAIILSHAIHIASRLLVIRTRYLRGTHNYKLFTMLWVGKILHPYVLRDIILRLDHLAWGIWAHAYLVLLYWLHHLLTLLGYIALLLLLLRLLLFWLLLLYLQLRLVCMAPRTCSLLFRWVRKGAGILLTIKMYRNGF